MMVPAHLQVAGLTDVGRQRDNNEDFLGYFNTPNGLVFIVCDGLGGHAKGEVASRMTVQTICEFMSQTAFENPFQALTESMNLANEEVYQKAVSDPSSWGMGTTCVLGLYKDDKFYWAHVGDSRIYHFRNGNGLIGITKDHSVVQEMVERGIITQEESLSHPKRHLITQAIGTQQIIHPSVCEIPIEPKAHELFLLCTDGLTGMLEDKTIETALRNTAPSAHQQAKDLIEMANNAGGVDNVTVLIIKFLEKKI